MNTQPKTLRVPEEHELKTPAILAELHAERAIAEFLPLYRRSQHMPAEEIIRRLTGKEGA